MTISSRALVDLILLGPMNDRRQLQDSPILGDVWIAYAEKPKIPFLKRHFWFFGLFYSCLKASIGLRLAAFRAGYQPKKIPITEQTRKESAMASVIITIGKLSSDVAT